MRKDEAALAALRKDYNNGEPMERQGDERNYQKYQDRVAQMRDAIDRAQGKRHRGAEARTRQASALTAGETAA